MNILHTVELYDPSKGGSQEVVKQLSEHMVKAGHKVTVVTTKLPERKGKVINGVKIVEFDVRGNILTGYNGETEEYKNFLYSSNFDVVMNYAAQNWTTDIFFEVMDSVKGGKVIVPCGFSHLYTPQCKGYFKKMPAILNKYNYSVYLSNNYRDINFAKKHNVNNLAIIPNGADEREFNKQSKVDIDNILGIDPKTTLIYQGGSSFTGLKGQLEAIKIFEKTSFSDAILLLSGNIVDKKYVKRCKKAALIYNLKLKSIKKSKKVIIKHLDRQATIAAFQRADIFLFPSLIEASPIVLFEACASKTPFLTTDVGNAKEIIKWTGGGKLLPTKKAKDGYSYVDVEGAAHKLDGLYNDINSRKALAESGYKAWKDKYNWRTISDQYLRLYKEIKTK